MAKFTRRILGSIPSQIRTYAFNLLDRLFGPKEIKQRVSDRFGPSRVYQVADEIKFYRKQEQAAVKYELANLNANSNRFAIPTTRDAFSLERYHIKFNFKNPRTGETEQRGYPIDVPAGLTKRQIQGYIRGRIRQILWADYENRVSGPDELNKRIGPIRVSRIESL